ncbi:MAG TPA: hypothetical protein VIL65_08790 [Beijerinckiaceae bacterium]|jgi:hypothetical protein
MLDIFILACIVAGAFVAARLIYTERIDWRDAGRRRRIGED